ncbi:MAG: TrkA family potassium uptake protein [Eubacterium sp.]|nr:TrkA family potassium uptake protein [Eubacterium sp.]
MQSVLVIGAGKFGYHLAKNLCDMGNDVMLVDENERKIEEYSSEVTSCEIGDYTVKANLKALGVDDYDYVFVCIGDFQDSVVITSYLKELGARYVISKASSLVHEKFLIQNGADKVVYPERDMAYTMAVSYNNTIIHDYFKLSDQTGIYEIEPPYSWIGKSLKKVEVRKAHGVTVIAYKNGDEVKTINSPDYVFKKNEHIIIMGENKNIKKIIR